MILHEYTARKYNFPFNLIYPEEKGDHKASVAIE